MLLGQRVPRQQEGQAEHGQADLDDQVERPPAGRRRRSRRCAGRGAPRHDHQDGHGDRRTLAARERVRIAEGAEQVVRQEERRERDRDHVVEHRRPAGDEPDQVVEGPAREGRRTARLGDGGPALGVGGRRQREQEAGGQEHHRRHRERIDGGQPQRVVQRAADLAVGDREQAGAPRKRPSAGIFRAIAPASSGSQRDGRSARSSASPAQRSTPQRDEDRTRPESRAGRRPGPRVSTSAATPIVTRMTAMARFRRSSISRTRVGACRP